MNKLVSTIPSLLIYLCLMGLTTISTIASANSIDEEVSRRRINNLYEKEVQRRQDQLEKKDAERAREQMREESNNKHAEDLVRMDEGKYTFGEMLLLCGLVAIASLCTMLFALLVGVFNKNFLVLAIAWGINLWISLWAITKPMGVAVVFLAILWIPQILVFKALIQSRLSKKNEIRTSETIPPLYEKKTSAAERRKSEKRK
jgi:hypothetical protein